MKVSEDEDQPNGSVPESGDEARPADNNSGSPQSDTGAAPEGGDDRKDYGPLIGLGAATVCGVPVGVVIDPATGVAVFAAVTGLFAGWKWFRR